MKVILVEGVRVNVVVEQQEKPHTKEAFKT
jgi:hypothetical protein